VNMPPEIRVHENLKISTNSPCFFIAEAGVNHNGDLENAISLIDVAVDAGADAVKFQTFNPSKIATSYAPKSTYHIETTGDDSSQSWLDLLKSQQLSFEDHDKLIRYANSKKIIFMSTPYDHESVDILSNLGVSILKVASTDMNNYSLLRHMAKTNLPIILSTAMSEINEIVASKKVLNKSGCENIAILQCTGSYPAETKYLNINAMKHIERETGCMSGFSDHSTDILSASVSVAAGANIYEKHFTLDKKMSGPDHRASLEPSELKSCVKLVRQTELMLGSGLKSVLACEQENRLKLRKFSVSIRDLPKGHILLADDITVKRTGGLGFPANEIESLIGCRLTESIKADQPINEQVIKVAKK
jgi:N,N'-diacetyllegionaminate synthase